MLPISDSRKAGQCLAGSGNRLAQDSLQVLAVSVGLFSGVKLFIDGNVKDKS